MRIQLGILALLLFAVVQAQNKSAVKYANSITPEDLRRHLTILASDEFEGRETGKKGQKMAAKYIADYFKLVGLKAPVDGSYFQEFELTESKLVSSYLRKGEEKKKVFEDYIYYSKSETEGEEYISLIIAGETVNTDSYEGAYVVYQFESLGGFRDEIKIASEAGALGIFIILSDEQEYKSTFSRFSRYLKSPSLSLGPRDGESDKLIIGNISLLEWTFGKNISDIKPGDKTTIVFNADYLDRPLATENVLGLLKGSEKPEEIVVISAHYDHIGIIDGEINNGADDDGSGTVSVLELAEAFSMATKKKKRPKRSILFMTVTGEEKGLLGSSYYTDVEPVFPLENTVVDFNIDMVGRVDEKHADNPDYIYVIGSDKLSQTLHDLHEEVNKTYTQLELDYTYNDENDPNRFYYRSDHYNFAKNNIPVIFYFNGTHPDYHQPTDTIEKINFDKMSNVVKLIFYTVWEVANREERIVAEK